MPHSVHGTPASSMSNERTSFSTTDSADQFPKQAGATLVVPDRDPYGQLSPAHSAFSFEDGPLSPRSPQAEYETLADRKEITRTIEWGAPGEKKESGITKEGSYGHKMRGKMQYYEDRFNERDTTGPVRDRVTRDSPVIAELKTNVIIKDEYTMVTSLSNQLSRRFQRPESSIMVSFNHSACLFLGGSFDPAYILDITALPSQLGPTMNKRNAALLQDFMLEISGVEADRGIVRFKALAEENMAINGRTILGEIEQEERKQAELNGSSIKRAMTKGSRRSSLKPKSSLQLSRKGSARSGRTLVTTPPLPSPGPFDSVTAIPEYATREDGGGGGGGGAEPDRADGAKAKDKSAAKKKTRLATIKSIPSLTPPPVPEDAPKPKIGKRKSFAAIFRI